MEREFAPSRKAHPALGVRAGEIEALAARIAQAGSPVLWDEALAVRRFYTEDPWGGRIELIEARG